MVSNKEILLIDFIIILLLFIIINNYIKFQTIICNLYIRPSDSSSHTSSIN